LRVAVLFGGPSPESEISRKSAESVAKGLAKKNHEVFLVELTPELPEVLKVISPDKVFIALHGVPGEDGTVQGLLEILGYEYTGCDVFSSAVCMDKDFTKRILKTHGIPVPAGETFFFPEIPEAVEIPCVVKPAKGGSTIGTSIVKRKEDFKKAVEKAYEYDNKILVEEYIEGRELTVGVLNGDVFPIVEVVAKDGFYDYSAKYERSDTKYIVPAEIPPKTRERIEKLAKKVYKVLSCKGAVRVDMRLDKWNNPYVLEVNTIPGLTERSLLPKSAMKKGMSFEELVDKMLKS